MSVKPTTAPMAWFATHRGEVALVVVTALMALAAGGAVLYFGFNPSHVVQLPFNLKLSLPPLISGSAGVALGITLTVEIASLIRKRPATKLKRIMHEVESPQATVLLFYKKGTTPNPNHLDFYREHQYSVVEREVWGRVEEIEEELGETKGTIYAHAVSLPQICGDALCERVSKVIVENTPVNVCYTIQNDYVPINKGHVFQNARELEFFLQAGE